jgi:hypothetical protein
VPLAYDNVLSYVTSQMPARTARLSPQRTLAKGRSRWRRPNLGPLTQVNAATFGGAGKLYRTRIPRNPTHLKRADVRGLEDSGPVNRTKMFHVKHFGTIARPDRSSLMPVGSMTRIDPIVAGKHFSAAPRPQCRIPEQRRLTELRIFRHIYALLRTNMDAGVAAPVAIERSRPWLVYLRRMSRSYEHFL